MSFLSFSTLFQVGWTTTKDYHTFVWVEPCIDVVGEQTVTRQAFFKGKKCFHFCFQVNVFGCVNETFLDIRFFFFFELVNQKPFLANFTRTCKNKSIILASSGFLCVQFIGGV